MIFVISNAHESNVPFVYNIISVNESQMRCILLSVVRVFDAYFAFKSLFVCHKADEIFNNLMFECARYAIQCNALIEYQTVAKFIIAEERRKKRNSRFRSIPT